MHMIDIIEKKRDGLTLSTAEINWFIQAYTDGTVPDYQASALLMAIFLRGMSRKETVDLTLAMANSGDQLDLHDVAPFVIDKHSSGGVGDKTTLAVQPLVAACGVPVGKMSGRGLGSSGGTLDKMESIRNWSLTLPLPQFKQQLSAIGLVLAGQTAKLAPADGKLYSLRDVTGTVASTPLIAASIMSKKLAAGADAIVLDVKLGSGAFVPTLEKAEALARVMVDIGKDAGRKMVALLSDMNQPLGHAIGNALEVKEAIAALQGDGPDDFWAHCLEVGSHMLHLAGKANSVDDGKEMITAVRDNGAAFAKFREMVIAQGGDITQVDNPDTLPKATYIEPLIAPHSGNLSAMDTGEIGWTAVRLGGGRLVKSDKIDHAVGFLLTAKIGDTFQAGDSLGEIHANSQEKLDQARTELLAALTWSDEAVEQLPHFYGTVS
ncbi:MAG: thymidine phosphorylase [Chloroflexi bacterium]|nr:thymidine phosphorylase [Chloroflexota bacterium]